MSNGNIPKIDSIPKEIKSENYLTNGMFLFDIVFIAILWLVGDFFSDLIYGNLVTFYTLLNIVIGVILTRKTSTNPQKRVFQALIIKFMSAKRNKYHQIGERQND